MKASTHGSKHQMEKYFGESSKYLEDVEKESEKYQKNISDEFSSLVLERQIQKMLEKQRELLKKDRDRRVTTKEGKISERNALQNAKNDKTFKEYLDKTFKLAERTINKFNNDAIKHAEAKHKQIEVKYKKSFALLANAEFGYMYSEHAEEITDLVKKQVLLSLYAAASGRGYIIFNGERFKVDDYFEKDVQGAPFLKIGK